MPKHRRSSKSLSPETVLLLETLRALADEDGCLHTDEGILRIPRDHELPPDQRISPPAEFTHRAAEIAQALRRGNAEREIGDIVRAQLGLPATDD